ncbi:hypothetical protein EON65_45820, partial [archaeon]
MARVKDSMMKFYFLIALMLIARASGSAGDADYDFVMCRRKCFRDKCHAIQGKDPLLTVLIAEYNRNEFSFMKSIRADQSLLPWSCLDQCTYTCSQQLTFQRMLYEFPPHKFFGHWPFIRWYGLEEPASALFSALNAISHVIYLCGGYLPLSSTSHMRFYINIYAIIALNAWIASVTYHSKKTDFSSLYDYVSALLLLLYGCTLITVRILSLPVPLVSSRLLSTLSILITCLLWILQAYRLANGQVGYSAHMTVCITLLVVSFLLYVVYTMQLLNRVRQHAHVKRLAYAVICWCMLTQAWLGGAGLLEVFDFPPL